jgi:hypothetical protein
MTMPSVTDEMVDTALDAHERTAGTRRDLMRAAVAAVYPAIRTEVLREEQERVAKLMRTALHASSVSPRITPTEREVIEYTLTTLCRVVAPQHVGFLALAQETDR